MTRPEAMAALIDKTIAEFGRIDIFVNSAGAHLRKAAFEVTPDDWDRIHDSNLKALFCACQKAGLEMRARGGGAILNVASMSAFGDFREASVYGISKAGVVQLTRSLASA